MNNYSSEWGFVTQNFKTKYADNIDISSFLIMELINSKASLIEEEKTLVVYIKNKVFIQKLSQYKDVLEDLSFEVYSKRYKIHFELQKTLESQPTEGLPIFNDEVVNKTNTNNLEVLIKKANLKKELTIESYLQGVSNKIALAAAQRIIDKPGESFNPFFLYGSSGHGKTHLVNSIGIEILKKYPNYKVLYVTFENFLNDFMDIFSHGNRKPLLERGDFRTKYRTLDVLIIDDIQGISGKEGIEGEFFNIFNELQKENKQIILTSDVKPSEFSQLPERIRSRLSMGMVIDIEKPEYELRYRLIKSKALRDGFELSNEAIDFVAQNVTTNFRELEGAYNKIKNHLLLTNESPSREVIIKALKDITSLKNEEDISPRTIIDKVCSFYKIKKEDIKSESRKKNIAEPRQVCMYLLKKHTKLNLNEIASLLNKKDHTTVMHGISKIEENLTSNSDLKEQISLIKSEIFSK
jgi:chromosomal replication initiator protein